MDVEWKHALPGLEGAFLWGGGSFEFAEKADLYTGLRYCLVPFELDIQRQQRAQEKNIRKWETVRDNNTYINFVKLRRKSYVLYNHLEKITN